MEIVAARFAALWDRAVNALSLLNSSIELI